MSMQKKRPTRAQKQLLVQAKKQPDNWLFVKEEPGNVLVFQHRDTNSKLRLAKA